MPTLVSLKRNLKQRVSTSVVRRLGDAMLRSLELPEAELSVLLTDDRGIHALNLEHRNKDCPTDVLAFPMQESPPNPRGILGDVVISLDTTARQAKSRQRELIAELRFLLAHGVLHLLGYDHGTAGEKREMVRMTRRLVRAAPIGKGSAPTPLGLGRRQVSGRRPKRRSIS